jgi:glycosyltransferase involved in cell wall biosynthesis
MKIVIDARQSGTSTGRYIDKLIEYLQQLKPNYKIVILTTKPRLDFIHKIAPKFEVLECPYKEFTFGEQLGLWKQLQQLKPDLVHFGMVQQPVLYRGKVVTTMHDLITTQRRYLNPARNPIILGIKLQAYKLVTYWAARKSAAIITPTEYIKDAVARYTRTNSRKITVTYEAADPITDEPEPLTELEDKQFIMYVGRPTPHKNLERLIEAFIKLREQQPELHLVLAGKLDTNYRRIERAVRQKDIKNVIFTGFVSEGQLRWLYEHCAAYVFPSLSEGFGLPALEAMTHGAPVVSSNATCLPEVYRDAAHYFDPLDVEDMARAIDEVLTKPQLREKLITAGHKQVKKYSWRRMAEQTLDVYKQVLGEK